MLRNLFNPSTPTPERCHDKVINFVWLQLGFNNNNAAFVPPIPDRTVENIALTAKNNKDCHVRLWVDSKRLTAEQIKYFLALPATHEVPNLSICDLRAIHAYTNERLFNQPDTNPDWRLDKHSLIWRQVDAARILASLEGSFSQSFYVDADIKDFDASAPAIQSKLSIAGVVLAGGNDTYTWYENQAFGFDRRQVSFFKMLYSQSINYAHRTGKNGYDPFIDLINADLKGKQKIDTSKIVFSVQHTGDFAQHNDKTSATSACETLAITDPYNLVEMQKLFLSGLKFKL